MKTDIKIDDADKIKAVANLTRGLWKVEGEDILVLVLMDHPHQYPARGVCVHSGGRFDTLCEEFVAFNLDGSPHPEAEYWNRFTYVPVYGTLTFDCRKP